MRTRFVCSYRASETWRRLRNCYALLRVTGDPQVHGRDWAKAALASSQRNNGDLGTEARMLLWDAQSRFMLLEARGPSEQAGVALARRSVASQRLYDVRKRYGLDYDTAGELLEKAKEWLYWALSDDDELEPTLDWNFSCTELSSRGFLDRA